MSIFDKNKARKVTEEGRKVIKEVTEKLEIVEQVQVAKKPKKKKQGKKFVQYKAGLPEQQYIGVVVKEIDISKKYPRTPTLYVVTVVRCDGQRPKPHLKWINKEYCTNVKAVTIDYLDKNNFDFDWMNNDGS